MQPVPSTKASDLDVSGLRARRDGAAAPLDWARLDIEERLGFSGARFTRTNNVFTGLVALVMTIGFFACLIPLEGRWIAEMFTKRGPTPYAIVFLSSWAVAILLVKGLKLRVQRRALAFHVMPEDPSFILSSATVEPVLARIYATVDDPRNFVLFNRIVIVLSNLRNLGQVTDVDTLLRSQAEQDESTVDTSYALVQGFVWAIPVLGFIGTVLGLSEAIGQFSGVLGSADDIENISQSLKGVTAGLSTAFETTLAALVAALFIQLGITLLKKSEEEFLDDAMEYGLRSVVGRLRILGDQPQG
jgi:biopolymer transport protein ExbB/TolQ